MKDNNREIEELLSALHVLEQKALSEQVTVQQTGDLVSLFDEGYRIIKTIEQLTYESQDFSTKTQQAFRDGLFLMTLETLKKDSLNHDKAKAWVKEIVSTHCLEKLCLLLDLTQDELEQNFNREDKAVDMLEALKQKFHVFNKDEVTGCDYACMDESLTYALNQVKSHFPKLELTEDPFLTSEYNYHAMARLVELCEPDFVLKEEFMLGLPVDVAFRVGMCYYQGCILPLDHFRANYWIAYAAALGYPQARLAYNLFFGDIVLYTAEAFEEYLNLMKGLYLQTVAIRNGLLPFMAVDLNYTYQGQSRNFEQDLLLNLTYLLIIRLTRMGDEFADECGSEYKFLIDDLISAAATSNNLKIKAALALMFTRTEGFIQHYMLMVMLEKDLIDNPALKPLDIVEKLLQEGLESNDYDSLVVYNLISNFSRDDKKHLKYLKTLAELGEARAQLSYSGALVNKRNNSDATKHKMLRLWEQSGQKGYGLALINMCIDEAASGLLPQSRDHAKLALDSGITNSLYCLYKLYENEQPELACTYLRYSSNYLYPLALKELAKLKSEGSYKPLPYMRTLEELESLAEHNAQAATLMSSLYCKSGLIPSDPFMCMHWLRKAVMLGDPVALEHLQSMYGLISNGFYEGFYLRPVIATLNEMGMNLMMNWKEQDNIDAQIIRLMDKMLSQLRHGKTELEHEILVQTLKEELFAQADCDKILQQVLKQQHNHSYYYGLEQWVRLLTGNEEHLDLNDFRQPLYAKDRLKRLLKALELTHIEADDKRPSAAGARALMSIRSATLPCNLKSFYANVEIGARGNDEFCTFMEHQNYDVLGEIRLGVDALQQVEDEHVFISGVSQ